MGKRGKGGSGGQRTSARSRAIAKQNQQQKEDMWDAFEKCKVEESQQLENMKNDSTNTAGSNSGSEDELELPPFPLAILNGQTEDKKLVKKLTKEGLIKEFNMGSNWPGLCLHPEGDYHCSFAVNILNFLRHPQLINFLLFGGNSFCEAQGNRRAKG